MRNPIRLPGQRRAARPRIIDGVGDLVRLRPPGAAWARYTAPAFDGTAAAIEPVVEPEPTPIVAADIVAAIHLVRTGTAERITLTGFTVPADLPRAADDFARAFGCRAIARIGTDGVRSLEIVRDRVPGG